MILVNQGKFIEAEPICRDAIEKGKEALGENHPQVAAGLNNLAILLMRQGKFTEAEPLCREAIEKGKQALGENHPQVVEALKTLAKILPKLENLLT